MADSTTYTISSMKLSDGTTFNVAGMTYTRLSDKGNLEISTPPYGTIKAGKGGKMNLEPDSNLCVKAGGAVQMQTQKYHKEGEAPAVADASELRINVVNDAIDGDEKVEGLNINTAGLTFSTKDAQESDKAAKDVPTTIYPGVWDKGKFPLHFKKKAGEWTKLNVHANAIDLRTRTLSAGTGGGIALQIASCDGGCKENKLKIETSRTLAPKNGLPTTTDDWSKFYVGEGGKGIEIGTINSQYESLYTSELRRCWDTDVFAVSRAPVTIIDDKYDFPTQADDTKDIKSVNQCPVKWVDIINAVTYLKSENLIPTDNRLSGCYMVRTSFTNVSSTNTTFAIPTSSAGTATYSATIGALNGYTLTADGVKYSVNGGEEQTAEGGVISLAAGQVTGDIVITAAATKNV